MAPRIQDDDWSDSDDDELSELKTQVSLGIPDGAISDLADLVDVAVSRIGGHPAFITSKEPPIASAHCRNCSNTMELLMQMWCPFEDSPMDRSLYVWGCSEGKCKGKEGSIRAWRGLRYNESYANKLKRRLLRHDVKQDTSANSNSKSGAAKSNPFCTQNTMENNPLGLGSQIFGTGKEPRAPADATETDESDSESSDSSGDSALVTVLAPTVPEESPWRRAPSFQPLYLSTTSEYIPAPKKMTVPTDIGVEEYHAGKKDEDQKGFSSESYENSLEIDHVFARFSQRVSYEGQQCVRYDLKGMPLPFASDDVFRTLFHIPSSPFHPVQRADANAPSAKRTYNTASIPCCPVCGSARTFECQLMPNLINVLRSSTPADDSAPDDERTSTLQAELITGDKPGMEWGTCMIFSCIKDCYDRDDLNSCWREEFVLVQWDA